MKRFLSLFTKEHSAPMDAGLEKTPVLTSSLQREEVNGPIMAFLDELYDDLSGDVSWEFGTFGPVKYLTYGELRVNIFDTFIQLVWPNGETEELRTSCDERCDQKIKQICAMARWRWETLEKNRENTALLKMSERYRKNKIPK